MLLGVWVAGAAISLCLVMRRARRFGRLLKFSSPADRASLTVDRGQRTATYRQIQELLVEELPYYWLVETPTTRAWAARCGGLRAWTGLFAEAAFCKK